jgi:hypothetical protein
MIHYFEIVESHPIQIRCKGFSFFIHLMTLLLLPPTIPFPDYTLQEISPRGAKSEHFGFRLHNNLTSNFVFLAQKGPDEKTKFQVSVCENAKKVEAKQ